MNGRKEEGVPHKGGEDRRTQCILRRIMGRSVARGGKGGEGN